MVTTHQGLECELLPEKAVFLPTSSTLIASDIHLGKAATFQAHGLPIPLGDDQTDLERLSALIGKTKARNLVIAGDLFHSPAGMSPALSTLVSDWMRNCPAKPHLILGNHDRRSLSTFPLPVTSSLTIDGFRILHEPGESTSFPTICGHLHPAIRIRENSRSRLRTPCFWFSGNKIILPAFGTFTGGQVINPAPNDRIFAPLNNRVMELPPECWR